ncbi:hypothetical protein KHQ82_09585 [Mycoplasmatota bacterium]|nr:hypothetical protein KHQ82_09585 [Mycoplasmatota bacterium]
MYVLVYNPKARGNRGDKSLNEVIKRINGEYIIFNVLEIEDYGEFLSTYTIEDEIIVIGGDGTLSRFANNISHIENIKSRILFYAGGTGNDFMRNYKAEFVPYHGSVDKVIAEGDITRIMLNGFGVGVDCEVIERSQKARKKTKISYAFHSIMSFFSYKPTEAIVTVDGETRKFKKTWLIVAQNGKNFGGGMNVTPEARNNDGILDFCIVHNISRLKLLFHFPKVYSGSHVKLTKYFTIVKGKEILIKMSEARMHQVDGDVGIQPQTEFRVYIDE